MTQFEVETVKTHKIEIFNLIQNLEYRKSFHPNNHPSYFISSFPPTVLLFVACKMTNAIQDNAHIIPDILYI